ncbi:bifunctional orotidine-5'-phosphate decarboxylase/orotate phosphoribosyltransferase [Kamptonema sp. UHCC 0994]|uniref:bifunctional orotidine-5'-phosphate decarboxylase/orotate phosphoribosyltransferase n=1 Tax=Kamptonema sp. UHCC 0994 TaxID=3031329 RepID=UPI0023B98EAB|nr:bifunctional orotidine-5'-phosphate decarboxylase/orotate phosphoribosyltransferase [Kamptonema sp. UHCC 0994]MDF0553861.1 bifunctional orotidine-5'-phosphate decarboxylase/orotate phosphoribosyltransferase [Kamptonema sp. UHCC 0994]
MNIQPNFFDKLLTAIDRNQSLLYVALDPDPENFSTDSPATDKTKISIANLRDYLQFVIAKTADFVCAYKLSLGFYQALGTPGLELLQQTLKSIPAHIPVILDAKYGDLNTSTAFARTAFEDWQVDAVTLSPYAGLDQVTPFLVYPGKAVFILCATANPSAATLQEYPTAEHPLYLELVQAAQSWGTLDQLGLEVGVMADMLARIRKAAPERLILIHGDIAEENDLAEEDELTQILAAGLSKNGEGLLLPVPPNLLAKEDNGKAINELRNAINEQRIRVLEGSPTCDLWLPDVCFLQPEPHRDLILQLYDIGCITFGDHVQASGVVFPYYIDLRPIISIPQIFHLIVSAYADILKDLKFDRIAGIPYGSLPTATGLALRMERPMIFPRKEVKAYGAGRLIEGHFQAGEMIVVVDDILISGKSAMEGAAKLKSAGLDVEDIVVFIDHGQGVKDRLHENGYQAHAVLTLLEIAQILYQSGRIDSDRFNLLTQVH